MAETKQTDRVMPRARYLHLYKFASKVDFLLAGVGSICSIVTGVKYPIFWFLFGNIIEQFNEFGILAKCGENCNGTTNFSVNAFSAILGHDRAENISIAEQSNLSIQRVAYVGLVTFVVASLQGFCWSLFGSKQASKIRLLLYRAVLRQDIAFHETASVGELNKHLTEDVDTIENGLSEMVPATITSISSAIMSFVVAMLISWKLSLAVLALSPLLVFSRTLVLWSNNSFKVREHNSYTKAGTTAEETVSSIRTVTSLGCQEQHCRSYEDNLKFTKTTALKNGLIMGGSIGCTRVSMGLIYGISFWYGIQLYMGGELQGGGEIASILFLILFMARNLGEAVTGAESFENATFAGGQVLPLIDQNSNIDVFSEDGSKPDNCDWSIEFHNVDFSYDMRPNEMVLSKFMFCVPTKKTVAIVGSSGCGKTTVAKLVQRWYNVNNGTVMIGGHDVRKLNVLWLRQQIGFVSQEPTLFNTTIAENIRWGRDDVTEREMLEVARQANALNFIMGLPNKFETVVGDRGIKLSGGQKQRIAIARALVRDPKILLLDEATSALDAENEAQVQSALEKASRDRTTIIIAHRLCTVKNADKIYVMDNGKVVEEGRHIDLVKKPLGRYKSLIEHQSFEGNCRRQNKAPEESCHDQLILPGACLSHKDCDDKNGSDKESVGTDKKEVPFFKVLALSKPEWPFLSVAIAFAAIAGSADGILGLLYGYFLSVFLNYQQEVLLSIAAKQLTAAFVGVSLIDAVAYTLERAAFFKCQGELSYRLRSGLFRALMKQEIAYFDRKENNCPSLCTRLSYDAEKATGMTIGRISYLTKLVSSLVCAVVICFVLSWKLGFFAIAITPVILVSTFFATAFFLRRSSKEDEVGEIIGNITTVVSLTAEHRALKAYEIALNEQKRPAIKKACFVGLSFGFSQAAVLFVFAAVFRFGLYLMVNDGLPPENVYKITAVIIFAAILAGRNAPFAPNVQVAKSAAKRVFALLERQPRILQSTTQNHKPSHCTGNITFENVSFRYPTRPQHCVLDGLNFAVKSGETVAIVGKSGCGKSTCVQLLQRFYDVDNGFIKLDDCDIRKLDVSWLRQQLGVVEQEPVIFDRTIIENIRLGEPLQQVDVENLIKTTYLQETLDILEKSETKNVGRRGAFLSVGQKQRVAVARALARNPKILILDEATASLDAESEKIMHDALECAKVGRTCIIVAHRLSTVKNADKIVVIDKGKILEIGTHEELMQGQGAYSRLVEAQHVQ